MAASALLFAGMNSFARLANQSASWASVGAVRAFVGAFVAFSVARARGRSLGAHNRSVVFWRSLFGTASMLCTFYALSSKTLTLGDTVTLTNLTPVFLALLAPIFLGERTTWGVAIAIALALAGVVLVLHPAVFFGGPTIVARGLVASGPSARATAIAAVLSSFLASIAMMMLRRAGKTESPEAIAFQFSLFAGVVHTLVATLDPHAPSLRDALFMVLAGVCAGFAQIAMTHAYALESAARVGAMGYLAVVASALIGAAILRERPAPIALLGTAFVIASGLLITFVRGDNSAPRVRKDRKPRFAIRR
ncbi:MAG: DMT family transporter [Polyangiaceae bacterium]|nr:DMT family transporter [Polyangiaceae bacterium]